MYHQSHHIKIIDEKIQIETTQQRPAATNSKTVFFKSLGDRMMK